MKWNYIVYLIIIFCVSCKSLAYKDYMEGLEHSENLNYSEAINSYLKSWDKSPEPEVARGLAQAFLKTRKFEQAEEWYARLLRDSNLDSIDYEPFAKVLIANSKYNEAAEILQLLDPQKNNLELEPLWKTALKGKDFLNNPNDAIVKPLRKINSSYAEFGAFLSSDNELFFTSDRLAETSKNVNSDNALKSDVYGWTGNDFLTIYSGKWDKENKMISGQIYKDEKFESNLHVGPYFQAGRNAFITLTQAQKFEKNAKGSARNYTLFPEIFFTESVYDSLNLDEFEPLSFNSPFNYSVSDPFYVPSQNRLYFSSDMPGGEGEADLYYVDWTKEEGWSKPVNLGVLINTAHDERTPFVDGGDFYFSSDGHSGLGGLDVYKSEIQGESFGRPKNLGSPINSNRDDFGFLLINESGEEAFLASDRQGGMGMDDLYWIDLIVEKQLVLKGQVFDRESNELLPHAVITLLSKEGNSLGSFATVEDGAFRFNIEEDQELTLLGRKTGYLDGKSEEFTVSKANTVQDSIIVQNIYLDKIEVGKSFVLDNIYYDFDEWEIREDAKPELDKLVKILKENPTMEIELSSHTDSRGTDSYNLKLSEKRAQSAVNYLIEKGITESRLIAKGLGEMELKNSCSNGVACSDEQHQLNRRTEFKITAY